MTITQFTAHYQRYITEVEKVIDPSLKSIAEQLRLFDIKNHYICQNLDSMTEYEARGFVWTLFQREVINNSLNKVLK